MSVTDKIDHYVEKAVTPPFKGLIIFIWAFFVLGLLMRYDNALALGRLPDTDDYTYLNQVLDWLRGQGWFDNTQYRLAPPEGVLIHFTRFPQLPLALFIWGFHLIGISWETSAFVTAIIWPPVLFFVFLLAARWSAQVFISPDWSSVTGYIALFMAPLAFQFTFGRIDHHGLEAILTILALGCTARSLKDPDTVKWSIGAAGLLALSLVVALEVLPWILLFSAWFGLAVILKGRPMARTSALYGITLFLTSALLLAVYKSPSAWFEKDILFYSFPYVFLTALISLCLIGVSILAVVTKEKGGEVLRWMVGCSLALISGLYFLSQFPELLLGPYGGMDRELWRLFFQYISEMVPVMKDSNSFLAMLLPLLALEVSLQKIEETEKEEHLLWWLVFSLLFLSVVLALFYQNRFSRFSSLFAVIPLAAFMFKKAEKISTWSGGYRKLGGYAVLAFALGPLPGVVLPFLFQAKEAPLFATCNTKGVEKFLREEASFKNKSLLILNTINSGPAILFGTPHKVLAAPYHMNVRGNLEAIHFFRATNWVEAREIVQRTKIDLVLSCKSVSPIYYEDPSRKDRDVKTIAQYLAKDEHPKWLRKIDRPEFGEVLLYAVDQPALNNGTAASFSNK